MSKEKRSSSFGDFQRATKSLPSRLLSGKIQKVGDIFLADMAFTAGLAGAYALFKVATQAFLWGTLVLAFVSILIVPLVYLVCRSIEKKIEGTQGE